MHFSMTTATPLQIRDRLTPREDATAEKERKKWNPNADFQRGLVWNLEDKQKLIDSLKKRMPFGMITVVHWCGEVWVTDGKQRSNALASFMRDEYCDQDGKRWSEWTADQRAECGRTPVAVQEVELEDGEGKADILELFRRINTASKTLTAGQLFNSCLELPTMAFAAKVFLAPVEEDEWRVRIIDLRRRWGNCFCKQNEFEIRSTGNARSDLAFLAALVIPMLTDNSAAISTSFDIVFQNGLKADVNETEMVLFFVRMFKLLNIFEAGAAVGYFTPTRCGLPKLGLVAPYIFLIMKESALLDGGLKAFIGEPRPFFEYLMKNADEAEEWQSRMRNTTRYRNEKNLNADLQELASIYKRATAEGTSD
jgi:hypothetical protein